MRRSGIRATALVLLACCGCNSYVALATEPSAVGQSVRVTLTDTGSLTIAPQVGGVARTVEGSLGAVNDSAIVVAVSSVTRLTGAVDPWNGERVSIPRAGVATLERKETSVAKSIAVAVAIVAGAFLISGAIGGSQATGSTGGTPAPGTGQ